MMVNRGVKQMTRGTQVALPEWGTQEGQRRWDDDKFWFGHAEPEVTVDRQDGKVLGSGSGVWGGTRERELGSLACTLGVGAGGGEETLRGSAKREEERTKGSTLESIDL